MNVSNNLLDAIQARLQSVSDVMPSELRTSFDKLNDFEKMDVTDSRYAQWISDRVSQTKKFMNDYDKAVQSLKDSDETTKLKDAQKQLRDFILRLGSSDSDMDSDKSV